MSKVTTIFFIFVFYLIYIVIRLNTLLFNMLRLREWRFQRKKDIYYLEVFTIDGAGYNYRVKKWADLFEKDGRKIDSAFLIKRSSLFFKLTTSENLKTFIIITMIKRFFQIYKALSYKIVIVRRSVLLYNDYGDFFMEKFLYSLHPNIILDFDDDISGNSERVSELSLFQKIMMYSPQYFLNTLKYYNRFIVGSDYLRDEIVKKSVKVDERNICVIPTCVDYEKYQPKIYSDDLGAGRLIFGWIGGNHNLFLLETIMPALNRLNQKKKIELLIISGVSTYDFKADFPVKFVKYNIETEVADLLMMDIGLMPLIDDKVSRGKCGFKLIQYMGLGIPGVASAITVNNQIVDNFKNGWLVNNNDWDTVFDHLILNIKNIPEYGRQAREKIIAKYSFNSNYNAYRNFLFKE